MSSFVFNIAKGSVAYLATLPGSTDSMILVPLELANIDPDSSLIDNTTLSAILVGNSNEQLSVGRKTLTSINRSVDHGNNWVVATFGNDVYTNATGNAIGALLVCYKPDSSAADSAIIPLTKHDFVVTPNGADISILVPATGFYRAT